MSAPIVRFRCYRCDQLLGVSASKSGKTATCPRCRAELLVPPPDDDSTESPATTAELEPSVIPDPQPRIEIEPEPATTKPTRLAADPPGEFDLGAIEIEPERLIDPAARRAASTYRQAAPEIVAPFDPAVLVPPPEAAPFIPEETVVAEIRMESPRVIDRSMATRRHRGVELSPSAVTAWMLFVVLGLIVSFVGGMFVGHYVWKPETTATAPKR